MALKSQIQQLGNEKSNPCVTISLNTHRTHQDNKQDEILLKNLIREAEERVTKEFGKKDTAQLLKKLATMQSEIDVNYNLDSLHLFLSESTKEIIKMPWPTPQNKVHISETFAIRPILAAYSRSESYLVLVLTQNEVNLYEALNDGIIEEITNDEFPFTENLQPIFYQEKMSDAEYVDNLVIKYFNNIDKAFLKVHQETGLKAVVVCTEENFSRLMEVANKPSAYYGYVTINFNHRAPHQIAQQTWKLISSLQKERRAEAIREVKNAVSNGKVLTDLQEIYQAAIDGRGDLLVVHEDFSQPVLMNGERTFDLITDVTTPGAVDDITSNIAWQVLIKNGRVVFTSQDEIKELGNIVLKTRY